MKRSKIKYKFDPKKKLNGYVKISCPHCTNIPAKLSCCRCQNTRKIALQSLIGKEDMKVWDVPDCKCEVCEYLRALLDRVMKEPVKLKLVEKKIRSL